MGARKVLHEGKYLRLMSYKSWEYVERKGCTGIVAIAAMTGTKKVLLVEQYRTPLAANVIELPAGLAGDLACEGRESLATAAKRELLEETGYRAARMKFLLDGPASSGMSANTIAFFQASGLVKVHDGGGDENEDITVHEVPLAGVEAWLMRMQKKGRLIDPKIFVGLYFLRK